jgi:hypothetical protein
MLILATIFMRSLNVIEELGVGERRRSMWATSGSYPKWGAKTGNFKDRYDSDNEFLVVSNCITMVILVTFVMRSLNFYRGYHGNRVSYKCNWRIT